jgi:ubiquinone biosynthesis protein
LERLQDDVPPYPYEEARRIVEEEFDTSLEEVFQEFDQEPYAAASIAQVHRARIREGQDVIVKIQRPHIREKVEVDLEIMHHIAAILERHQQSWQARSPTRIVSDFSKTINEELDFTNEAAQQERFRGDMHDRKMARVPAIFEDYCARRVLTMEFIDGTKPSSVERLREEGLDPVCVAARGFDLLLRQIFVNGFFHADPHPGNILVLRGDIICYIDFGMMGTLSRRERDQFANLVLAIANRDEVAAAESFTRLSEWEEVPDHEALEMALDGFMDRHFHKSLKDMNIGSLLNELVGIIVSFKMRPPRNLLLVIKALTTAEGVGRHLDPNFDPIAIAEPFLRSLKQERYTPKQLAEDIFTTGSDFLELFRDMPHQVREILRKLRSGQIRLEFDHRGLDPLQHTIDKVSNRLSLSLLIGSIVIGSSIIVLAGIPPKWNEIPLIGIIGYLLAAIMGFALIISIWRERSNRE